MGNENAERLQTSLLNKSEKKVTIWLAKHQPAWVNSDMLSYLGLAAAVIYAVFCWLANYNVYYYWGAAFGLALNWYGDGVDGDLARVRNAQRPKYGLFIDHSLDALTTCLFCMGLGLGPLMQLNIALFIMGGYLCLSIFTYLSTIVVGRFPLTYAKLGPTEMRILIILVFIIFMYTPFNDIRIPVCGYIWSVYDCLGAVVAVILYALYINSMASTLRELAKIDPPKPWRKENR